jgi:arylsulfatase
MATFIELADATYPEQLGDRRIDPLRGKSLLPIFRGETRQPHAALYFHFGTDRALRQGPWKLVSAKLGKWELYNLAADRTELNDLSEREPGRVTAMEAEWFRIAEQVDRLTGRSLAPVGEETTSLSFRKDTRLGSASGEKKSAKKSEKKKRPRRVAPGGPAF